jgi:predicted DNA-binding transcriptional regulator AlpA
MNPNKNSPTQRLAFRVNEFCHSLGISRTAFYGLVKDKKIRSILVAGRRLVPLSEAERLLGEQDAEIPSAEAPHASSPKFRK